MTTFNMSETTPQHSIKIRKSWLHEMFTRILLAEQNYRQNARLRGMEDYRLDDMGLQRGPGGRIVRR